MKLEKAKLLIWDLDETFWHGTLAEEGIKPIPENIELVKTLAKRGIMNSIVSKNDFKKVEAKLKELGIWEYFVFPKISWQPKGEIVRGLLLEMKLRTENTVFVDDNTSNLAEVEFYNKGICCILPEELHGVLNHPAFAGKEDKDLTRLKQYHIMEERNAAESKFSSNVDFLRSSNIKMKICSDCQNEENRIFELIQRTNQLNYTKIRSTKEELQSMLNDDKCETKYIRVWDDFGDYGIVGFYALKNGKLIHFLFSCRTIGFGVENFIWEKLGYPQIKIVGDVTTELTTNSKIDWITVEQSDTINNDIEPDKKNTKILMVSGCDLQQSMVYLQSKLAIDTEFATVINGEEIRTSDTCSLVNTIRLTEDVKRELSEKLPFFNYDITFGTKLFSGDYRMVVLSVVDDYIRGMYQHKNDGYFVGFGGYYCQEEFFAKYPSGNWEFLEKNFVFVGQEPVEVFEENLRFIVEHIPSSTEIMFINGIDLDVSDWIGSERVQRNLAMNAIVDKIVKQYNNVSLLDMRQIVTSRDMLSKKDNRHFNRQCYYEIAKRIAEKSDSIDANNTVSLRNPKIINVKKDVKNGINNLKGILRKCGLRNPIRLFKEKKNLYLYHKINKKLSHIDYFNYEELVRVPELELVDPFNSNIKYGMFNPVKVLYGQNIDLNYDYIEHGLFYAEAAPLLLNILKSKKLGRIFTYSNRRKEQLNRILKKNGYNNEVVALGPIITAARNFHTKEELSAIKKKLGKTLLVFPMHSWPGVSNNFDKDELVQEIERIKIHFNSVMVCLYYIDILNGKHLPFIEKGYTVVCNGHKLDSYFISRQRDLIELSDLTMSNGIGTHIGYSIALNRPHYYFKQNMEQKIDPNKPSEIPEQEFRIKFEHLFVETFGKFAFEITDEQRNFVRYYWGDF